MTVTGLLASVGSRELSQWMAFYQVEAAKQAEAERQRQREQGP